MLRQTHDELQPSAEIPASIKSMSGTEMLELLQWEFVDA